MSTHTPDFAIVLTPLEHRSLPIAVLGGSRRGGQSALGLLDSVADNCPDGWDDFIASIYE